MDDKLNVLDIGKTVAKVSMMPWLRYQYDPSLFRVLGDGGPGFSLDPFNPKKHVLNNRITRGIGRQVNAKFGIDDAATATLTKYDDAVKAAGKTFNRGRSITSGIVSVDDGMVTFFKGSYKDDPIWRKLAHKRRQIGRQIDSYGKTIVKAKDAVVSNEQALLSAGGHFAMGDSIDDILKLGAKGADAAEDVVKLTKTTTKVQKVISGGSKYYRQGSLIMQKGIAGAAAVGYAGVRTIGKLGASAAMAGAKLGAYAAVAGLMWDVISPVGNAIGQAGIQSIDNTFNSLEKLTRPELGGQLNINYLSEGAATERQRALQAISKSRINGRSNLGMEAQYAHR